LGNEYPEWVELYAVEAKEVSPPAGEPPIHWRILTTYAVHTLADALQVIEWYSWRWGIEEVFRLLMKDGFDIEDSLMSDGAAVQKLAVLALQASVQVMQLLQARDGSSQTPATVFSPQEQTFLTQLAPGLQGSTPKQQNPFPSTSLAWAAWIIARLGGWAGYRSQRPPGPITFFRGLKQFRSQFTGWCISYENYVCTP